MSLIFGSQPLFSDSPSNPYENPSISTSLSKDEECPDTFVAGASYEEDDTVEVEGVVYQCKSWPGSQWCSISGYEPGGNKSDKAWDIIGYCEGKVDPAPSVAVVDERKLQALPGCPALYSSSNSYGTGDQVAVTSGASSIVYQCTNLRLCNSEAPGFSSGWTVIGHCEGTISPTRQPTATTTATTVAPTTTTTTVRSCFI